MPVQESENQILPFFFANNLPKNTAFDYREFDFEKYKVYAAGSLFSEHIKDLDKHISVGLDFLVDNFGKEEGEILDRMKASIFHSGDKLADFLVSLKEPVDDVDYSLALIAFADGLVYVWLDGGLNVRIYRGRESLIVNEDKVPQFYGSATVELGDIFAVGFQDDVKKADSKTEDYVLEKATPSYPGLFIDYQLDLSTVNTPVEAASMHDENVLAQDSESGVPLAREVVDEENISTATPVNLETVDLQSQIPQTQTSEEELDEDMQAELAAKEFESGYVPSRTNLSKEEKSETGSGRKFDVNNIQDKAKALTGRAKAKLADLRSSGVLQKIIGYVKLGGKYIWSGLLAVTGAVLDFIFGIVYRNSPHQFKRFQGSLKKRNLQYLIILILLITTVYFVFFRGGGTASTADNGGNSSNTANSLTKNETETRNKILQKQTELQRYYANAEVENFKTAYASLKTLVNDARSSGFNDSAFLNTALSTAQTQEDTLFKVTPISKVDEAFVVSDSIQNPNIVDFSYIGTDVYAIDKANASILKSNSATQSLELFASDKELSSMTNIACEGTSCYITDEGVGIVILDIQNKTFSKFSALKTAGQGVTEIGTFKVGNTVYIYLLNPTQGKVVRYSRSGQGLTTPITWNKSPGFSTDTVDFAIDGNIYEMSASGVLRRFYSGNVEASTSFAGLTAATIPLGTDLQIAATTEADPGRFYVADPVNERIVVYDKTLSQSKQYTFRGSYKYRGTDTVKFSGIKQLLVSGDEKSLYVLSDNIVFKVGTTAI